MHTRTLGYRKAPPIWLLLSAGLPLLAILLIVATVRFSDLTNHLAGVLFFFVLFTTGEILYVPLPRGGGVSIGLAVVLACVAVYGPGIGALISGLGMVIAIFVATPGSELKRYFFNFGQSAVSTFAAGRVFVLVGGNVYGGAAAWSALAFVAASATFLAINVTLVVLFLSSVNQQAIRSMWPDVKYTIASYLALVPLGLLVALIFVSYGIVGAMLFLVPLLFARFSFLQYLNTRNASLTVTQALAAALEAKDAYTRGHSDRVASYAIKVARALNLPEETVETLRYAAEMHDIGKIGISETLLNKPGSLTESELAEVRKHALIGADMVHKIEFLKGVSEMIRYHHEWFDGSNGYPRELAQEQIPLGARILMVCDSFDAMTSDRPYREGLDTSEAIQQLHSGSGRQFDPVVVEAFLQVLASGQIEAVGGQ